MPTFRALFLAFLLHSVAVPSLISAQRSKPPATSPWQTLNGSAPLVIAKGGFSGIFPDSSSNAYSLALMTSLPNLILWCDVQLTKDGVGICLPDVKLDNCTSIADYDKNGQKNYVVNGESTKGWFSVDYTLSDLMNVILVQNIWSRTNKFDGNLFAILTVEQVGLQLKPPGLWLNIQHDAFFTQHNLSMRSYVISVSKRVIVSYVSSPEVGFLRSIVSRFRASTTKLVFRFLDQEKIEPSTNQTYGSLLKNLTFIKTFASGIMVPKDYIWPVNSAQYLEPHTFLVSDAHKEGLEVFASGFANDFTFSYNYTYDPVAEYLSFVDNGDFSVDGVLSDFPITPSEAIDCFSHIRKNVPGKAKPVVVSHNGASGVYPGSTDLAYNQAVEDGADYIDCSVQMTSDGIPICLDSVSLTEISNAIQSPFRTLSMTIPDVQSMAGIFTFNLTWENIQSLKPAITNPPAVYTLFRNPAYKNAGSFQSLDQFLTFAKSKPIAGVVIGVEHAAYLAEKKGLDIVGAVLDALNKAGYNNGTKQEVTIQSTNKAVLTKFKAQTTYKRMYMVDETIRGADDATLQDIKSFADSVAISKASVFPENNAFITGQTTVVQRLHLFKLPVYVYVFKNEFVYQAWDFFSDPIVEINTYAMATGNKVDGIITDFPKTAVAYRKNKCLDMKDAPIYMSPVEPGSLMQVIPPQLLPPAEAPYPILVDRDVAESPLPPVVKQGPTTDGGSAVPPGSARPSGNQRITACGILSTVLMFLASVLVL